MASSPQRPYLPLLSAFGKRLVLLMVILAVSGAPGHVVQGIAWWQMAEKNGGLSQAIFDAEPCHLCHFAQDLSQEGDPESPAPDRSQFMRTAAVITDVIVAPKANARILSASHRFDGPDQFPGSRQDRPDLPPPRAVA